MNVYKLNTVVVPVDLSEGSLNALDVAVTLAKKHQSVLYILHVDENNFQSIGEGAATYFSNKVNAADIITALVGAIQHTHGIRPVVFMEEGNVAETIIKTSFLQHADLIVMGAHGASGYREGFIGNNAYNIIKYAPCPVLTIPHGTKAGNFKKILFPIRPVTGALMPYEIVRPFVSRATVMEVLGLTYRAIIDTSASVLESIVAEVNDQLRKDEVIPRMLWSNGISVAEEILKHASNSHPDLVVVTSALDVTSKAKYIGPHAQKIINCSKVPVLSIKKLSVPSLV